MSEKDKMLGHLLYDATDAQLEQERMRARELCFDFNNTRPSDVERQTQLMTQLLGQTHGAFTIIAPFQCDYGYNIEIGSGFYANFNTVMLDGAKITFGDNVFVGPNCGFYTAGHPIDAKKRNAKLEYAHPITIGDDVWIGAGVHVLPGVTIGSNVVIGAGSVVVHDIPNNSLAVGNPCHVIREIAQDAPA